MIVPVLHLNGSGLKNLVEPMNEAISKINEAVAILRENYPHMRDYYVLPDGGVGDYRLARAEADGRIHELRRVAEELNTLREAIYEQADERERTKQWATSR